MYSVVRDSDPAAVEAILRSLPTWFGIESAIGSYVADSARLPSYLLLSDQEVRDQPVGDRTPVGVALVNRHFPESAELHLIAVHADHRGHGGGRLLVERVVADLRADGCRFLEVHTVGESYPDEGYAQTRAFYQSLGFSPIHEFQGLDWDGPTVIMIAALTSPETVELL